MHKLADNKVIATYPVHGSGGDMVLFFRAKGTEYFSRSYGYDIVAEDDAFIIQWEGFPEVDSGYHTLEFASEEEALTAYERMEVKETSSAM